LILTSKLSVVFRRVSRKLLLRVFFGNFKLCRPNCQFNGFSKTRGTRVCFYVNLFSAAHKLFVCVVWFGHIERMDERRLTKKIYEADVGGNAGRGGPRRTFLDQIGEVLEKGQVKITRNRRAYMRNLMTVEEA
jgi:hypothetical protein